MKKFWNTDKIVSISAILIGVGSLIVVTYQTNLIRNQTELIQREQRTSIMPYLRLGARNPDPSKAEVYLSNSGLGPALIKEVRVLTQEDTFQTDLDSYFRENYQYNGYIMVGSIIAGDLISSGENITILGVNAQDSAFLEFTAHLENEEIIFEIVYESLYGERWLLSSAENIPINLEEE